MKIFVLSLLILVFLVAGFFLIGKPPTPQKIIWGANFSQQHTENLGLNWKETYLALLDDLGARYFKNSVQWDLIEPQKDNYLFDDVDWQINETEKRGGKIILVIGMKTSRWPECHIPDWAKGLTKEEQQEDILEMIKQVVLRYKDSETINAWQLENEPFFPFGECPWIDEGFVKEEVKLVKSLDAAKKPIIISDSGEGSFWIRAAKIADIVGTTLYRIVWAKEYNRYFDYPLTPNFYWRKAKIVDRFFHKKVICIELQAEPWGPKLLYDSPLEEQKKSMNLEQFKEVVAFAKKTGLDEFYFWGDEWWYWMKIKQNDASIWNEAKNLFH